jgi:hypothetical protein
MVFTWMKEQGRDEAAEIDILHVSADGREYVVYISDEASGRGEDSWDPTFHECKAIAERKIARNPSVKQVEVRSADRP